MIYLASSWRNPFYNDTLQSLRAEGFSCFDFRRPDGDVGFHWSRIDKNWRDWDRYRYRDALRSTQAAIGFSQDMDALKACKALVLIMPCGRSAHLELGFAIGEGKPSFIYFPHEMPNGCFEPELMYKAASGLCFEMKELISALELSTANVSSQRDGTLCEACIQGRHEDCHMAHWCECKDERDGQEPIFYGHPSE